MIGDPKVQNQSWSKCQTRTCFIWVVGRIFQKKFSTRLFLKDSGFTNKTHFTTGSTTQNRDKSFVFNRSRPYFSKVLARIMGRNFGAFTPSWATVAPQKAVYFKVKPRKNHLFWARRPAKKWEGTWVEIGITVFAVIWSTFLSSQNFYFQCQKSLRPAWGKNIRFSLTSLAKPWQSRSRV